MSVAWLAVLDTNVVLDLFMFRDPVVAPIEQALRAGHLHCVSDAPCLEELRRVLAYRQFGLDRGEMEQIMREYVAMARFHPDIEALDVRSSCLPLCRDPDDQKFLQLAGAAQAQWLVTKDKALLALARKKKRLGFAIVSPARAAELCLVRFPA